MVFALLVRDDKKGRPFEQQHLRVETERMYLILWPSNCQGWIKLAINQVSEKGGEWNYEWTDEVINDGRNKRKQFGIRPKDFGHNNLIGVNDVGKLGEVLFEDVNVWNEEIDDGRPSFVKSLVPNGRSEAGAIQRLKRRNGYFDNSPSQ